MTEIRRTSPMTPKAGKPGQARKPRARGKGPAPRFPDSAILAAAARLCPPGSPHGPSVEALAAATGACWTYLRNRVPRLRVMGVWPYPPARRGRTPAMGPGAVRSSIRAALPADAATATLAGFKPKSPAAPACPAVALGGDPSGWRDLPPHVRPLAEAQARGRRGLRPHDRGPWCRLAMLAGAAAESESA